MEEDGETGALSVPSAEREDGRRHEGNHYIPRSATTKFEDDQANAPADGGADESCDEEDSPCDDRWKNMNQEAAEKAWGIFDETGVFLCLCRHGFVLAVLDMVRSGELYVTLSLITNVTCSHSGFSSKYPLAVVEALIDAFGSDIGCGYNIGCRFSTALRKSSIGGKASKANFR